MDYGGFFPFKHFGIVLVLLTIALFQNLSHLQDVENVVDTPHLRPTLRILFRLIVSEVDLVDDSLALDARVLSDTLDAQLGNSHDLGILGRDLRVLVKLRVSFVSLFCVVLMEENLAAICPVRVWLSLDTLCSNRKHLDRLVGVSAWKLTDRIPLLALDEMIGSLGLLYLCRIEFSRTPDIVFLMHRLVGWHLILFFR